MSYRCAFRIKCNDQTGITKLYNVYMNNFTACHAVHLYMIIKVNKVTSYFFRVFFSFFLFFFVLVCLFVFFCLLLFFFFLFFFLFFFFGYHEEKEWYSRPQ